MGIICRDSGSVQQSEQGGAVALVWARSSIKQAMYQLTKPQNNRSDKEPDDRLKERIIQLGLDFSLVTQWTAFVAVSEAVYNTDPEPVETLPVPLPQVKAVSQLAYGKPISPSNTTPFNGHAAPEPGTVLGILLMMILLGWVLWQRPLSALKPCG